MALKADKEMGMRLSVTSLMICVLLRGISGQSCFGPKEPLAINCVNSCTCNCGATPGPVLPCPGGCIPCANACCCANNTVCASSASTRPFCATCAGEGMTCETISSLTPCCEGLICAGEGTNFLFCV